MKIRLEIRGLITHWIFLPAEGVFSEERETETSS
jgi:hypothetical protein